MDALIGKYEFVASEDLDNYLSGLGVGLVLRKVHSVATPELEINYSQENEVWTIRLESVFHRHILKVKPGEEVDDETFDVRPCKTILEVSEDGKLIMTQKCAEGPDVKTVIEKKEDETIVRLCMTMTSSDYKATQVFRPIEFITVEEEEEDDDNDDEVED